MAPQYTQYILLRYILYPEVVKVMVGHPVQSLFLGTFPMGLAMIINMFCFVCVEPWGYKAAYFVCPGRTTRANGLDLSSTTAAWLLPIVSCVAAAASTAIVADVLPSAQLALATIAAGYILWGVDTPFAWMVTCIYLQRLMIYKHPLTAVLLSAFPPLSPFGQGGFA
ncbi:voltage-dependent anion channel-domain-containing protein [Aspergillus multicolor]|uniref:voltage-dependent anion channel-domain-containing protein n=1 Tax=Aspergillus multicolor TaxID=41759 RepID=UPI003CCDFCDA